MRYLTAIALTALHMAPVHAETTTGNGVGAQKVYVTQVFSNIQRTSFAANRELCGYLATDRKGALTITEINVGEEDTCYLPDWPNDLTIVASFHTHSTYSPEFDSELPSSLDLESAEHEGLDGWVATPGGRLWYIDHHRMETTMVCGAGCLPQDPNFVDEPRGSLRSRYTYRALLKREGY